MNTNSLTELTSLTEVLARRALDLHRVARAADEVSQLQSPATRRDPRDISRPTEETALCPRRAHVREQADQASADVDRILSRLNRALDVWEGGTAP